MTSCCTLVVDILDTLHNKLKYPGVIFFLILLCMSDVKPGSLTKSGTLLYFHCLTLFAHFDSNVNVNKQLLLKLDIEK